MNILLKFPSLYFVANIMKLRRNTFSEAYVKFAYIIFHTIENACGSYILKYLISIKVIYIKFLKIVF